MTVDRLLVVDPDGKRRAETVASLADDLDDPSIVEAGSLAEARDVLTELAVDVVVTEHEVGDGTGLELARHVRSVSPDSGVVLYTAAEDVGTAAAEHVIGEYVQRDLPGADELLIALVEEAAGPEWTQTAYPLPEDEPARLAAIEAYIDEAEQVRDSLERVTDLAATHFEVEVSSLNLIHEHTQEMFVCHAREWTGSDREESVCTYTILEDDGVMAVEDTTEDPRFADSDLLANLGIRAYLGATVDSPDGHTIGTLCVYDDKPRSFSETDRRYLMTLSDLITDLLALADGSETM